MSYKEPDLDAGLLMSDESDDDSARGSGTPAVYVAGEGEDEIDLVLSHSRDEDHLQDEKDIPQINLVSPPSYLSQKWPNGIALPYQVEKLLAHSQHRRDVCLSQELQRVQKGRKLYCQGLDGRAVLQRRQGIARGVGTVRDRPGACTGPAGKL